MATPHSIPSKINTSTAEVVATSTVGDPTRTTQLYVTAILKSGTFTITIGGSLIDCGTISPVSFPSPLQCDKFNPQHKGQVAYYEQ